MKKYIDQTGRSVAIPLLPKRIVSIVPSQTELLFDLGLNETVVGITKFCVHPESWFRTKKRIGGTKKLNLDLISSLQPDLIIANKEENEKSQVEELAKHFPVWTSDISSLDDARKMILSIGEITGEFNKAEELLQEIDTSFRFLNSSLENKKQIRAAYLIWNNPMMTAGGDTFISTMMACAGFINVFEDLNRYPELTSGMIKEKNPEVILLSSEPFPFKEKHREEFSNTFGSRTLLVDGEMFSWYGSRLKYSPHYFQKLFEQIKSYN